MGYLETAQARLETDLLANVASSALVRGDDEDPRELTEPSSWPTDVKTLIAVMTPTEIFNLEDVRDSAEQLQRAVIPVRFYGRADTTREVTRSTTYDAVTAALRLTEQALSWGADGFVFEIGNRRKLEVVKPFFGGEIDVETDFME